MPESDVFALVKHLKAKQEKLIQNVPIFLEKSVLDLARARIEYAYDLFDTIVVSFSGGKDSTVCLQLTLEIAKRRKKLPLEVVFFDEEAIPYQTEDYVRRVANAPEIKMRWYCIPVKHRNACSRMHPWWNPWRKEEEDLWVRPLPYEAITELEGFPMEDDPGKQMSIPECNGLLFPPNLYGNIGMITGLRAQESMTRRRMLLARQGDSFMTHPDEHWGQVYGNFNKVHPIYDWKIEDVWTAPATFGWDYNRAYDVMEQAGIGMSQQRCSPAYGEEPMQGFPMFKACFPEIWDKMSMRVPGANGAYLYGKTEIYGYKKDPDKPGDMSWQDYILHYLEKFPKIDADGTAKAIKWCIEWHFRKTKDPILDTVIHPITGISWKRLANLAVRGDMKGRRSHSMTAKAASVEDLLNHPKETWHAYNEARKEAGL